jgi:hypothetical protein
VNEVINRALSLLFHQKKVWEQIQVAKEFHEDLPRWKGDPHQLQQVMINLFLNAADAMMSAGHPPGEKGKRLRVATRALPPAGVPEFPDFLPPRRKEDPRGPITLCSVPTGTPRPRVPRKSRPSSRWKWKTRAPESPRKPWGESSNLFIPPSRRGRGRAWAWPSASGSWNPTAGGSRSRARRTRAPGLPSSCRFLNKFFSHRGHREHRAATSKKIILDTDEHRYTQILYWQKT